MDLTDRYFAAVRMLLPLQGRDDIIAELRDELASRREAREAELGRPLARGEQEDLLRAFGNPITVAGRFGGLQTIVGPELFPVYRLVTFLLVGISFAAGLLGLAIAIWTAPVGHEPIGGAIRALIGGPISMVGFTTVGFAILDRTPWRANILRVLNDWDPRELPDFPKVRPRRRLQGWPHYVAGIVAQCVFIVCWVGYIPLWRLIFPVDHTGGAFEISFGPILTQLYWPVLAPALGAIVVEVAHLMGRAYRLLAGSLSIVMHLAVAGVAGWALSLGTWAVVTSVRGDVPEHVLSAVSLGVNTGFRYALLAFIVASVIAIGVDAWRMFRPEPAAA
jgi:hypothetical protein